MSEAPPSQLSTLLLSNDPMRQYNHLQFQEPRKREGGKGRGRTPHLGQQASQGGCGQKPVTLTLVWSSARPRDCHYQSHGSLAHLSMLAATTQPSSRSHPCVHHTSAHVNTLPEQKPHVSVWVLRSFIHLAPIMLSRMVPTASRSWDAG